MTLRLPSAPMLLALSLLSLGLVAPALGASAPATPRQAPADEPERLTFPRFSYPTWSPDGDRVLYESAVSGNWEIYVVDTDGLADGGGNVVQLTRNDSLDRLPSWSPDGRFVAFISDRDGDYEVFRMRADGSEQVQLTHDELPQIHPYWSPDGSRILFNTRVGDQRLYAIWSMRADGTDPRLLLQDEELNSYAQMSPDGARIVFDKWQDNVETNGEIYVLDVADGALHRLTDNDVYDGYPTWAPDGEHIVYASQVDGVFKLFEIAADGSGRRQLTFGPGDDMRADVSADGTRIVFNRTIDDNVNIYVLPLIPARGPGRS